MKDTKEIYKFWRNRLDVDLEAIQEAIELYAKIEYNFGWGNASSCMIETAADWARDSLTQRLVPEEAQKLASLVFDQLDPERNLKIWEVLPDYSRMTPEQMRTSWQLARRFNHHWAVDASEQNLTDAAAKMNMEDEIFHVNNEYYTDRICPESLDDAYMLMGLDPRVCRDTARNIMPDLDVEGNLVHRSGRSPYSPGRYGWTVFRDGACEVRVYRPCGVVLSVTVSPDGEIGELEQSGRYGFRHIIALEKMIASISKNRIPRHQYDQCDWQTDLKNEDPEMLLFNLMQLAGIDKTDYWKED